MKNAQKNKNYKGHDKLIMSFASNGDFQDAPRVLFWRKTKMRGLFYVSKNQDAGFVLTILNWKCVKNTNIDVCGLIFWSILHPITLCKRILLKEEIKHTEN